MFITNNGYLGNHLMAIIDDILDYSKIDSGKLSLEHRRLDLVSMKSM